MWTSGSFGIWDFGFKPVKIKSAPCQLMFALCYASILQNTECDLDYEELTDVACTWFHGVLLMSDIMPRHTTGICTLVCFSGEGRAETPTASVPSARSQAPAPVTA